MEALGSRQLQNLLRLGSDAKTRNEERSDFRQRRLLSNVRAATMRPRRRCATFPKCIAPAARENSSEGEIPVKAVRTHGRGGPEQLFFEDAPVPVVRPGDVLVRVRATGITPAELTWDETYQNADGTPRIPGIPGHEPSGVVEETAPDVMDFRVGDEIYGLADFPRDGTAAEFAAVHAANLALKPRIIPLVQAEELPLSALTA